MKLAFEKKTWSKWYTPTGLMDRTIGWWTQSPYCHVELWFDRIGTDLTISATKQAGVRWGHMTDLGNPARWTIVDVALTPEQERDAYAFAGTLIGQKYSNIGILRFVLGPVRDPRHEKFCSQTCTLILQHEGLYRGAPAERVDPGFLYDLATI